MTENLPILTGKIFSLISLFGLYVRLLDSISIVNSKQGIVPSKGEQSNLFHRNGLDLGVPVFCQFIFINSINKNGQKQERTKLISYGGVDLGVPL